MIQYQHTIAQWCANTNINGDSPSSPYGIRATVRNVFGSDRQKKDAELNILDGLRDQYAAWLDLLLLLTPVALQRGFILRRRALEDLASEEE